MAKRKGSSVPSSSRARKKADRDAREAENAQRLDKLPEEVWEKIFDELESDDLFPLALSCRYFRQKQKELVARARQSVPESGKPCLALKTNLGERIRKRKPASAEYLRFCRKEKGAGRYGNRKVWYIRLMAAYHGHLPLLQELQAGRKRFDSGIASDAAEGGQLETLQWLKTQEGFELGWWLFSDACKGGHLEVLKWLRSEGCPWNETTFTLAAAGGHLEALRWLRSEGCPWDEDACRAAARGGHLEILKWLRSEGCPWDERTCYWAARIGHLDVLKYARENGCPWDAFTWRAASESTREWLRENGCPQE